MFNSAETIWGVGCITRIRSIYLIKPVTALGPMDHQLCQIAKPWRTTSSQISALVPVAVKMVTMYSNLDSTNERLGHVCLAVGKSDLKGRRSGLLGECVTSRFVRDIV